MKRIVPIVLGLLAVSTSAFAQTTAETIERALAAAPRQAREGAAVIKWKADNTYETLKPGTNRMVCYDRSGEPGQQPFAVQCTSVAHAARKVDQSAARKVDHPEGGSFYALLI